jgi:hypothetical protein
MIWWISMSEHEHRVIVGHLPYCLITAMDKYWGDWISVYYAIVQCTIYKFVWFSVYLLPSLDCGVMRDKSVHENYDNFGYSADREQSLQ